MFRKPASVACALGLLSSIVSGCGGNPRRALAADALASTRVALMELEVESSGGEIPPEVVSALDRASVRLEETEHALDLWGGSTGSLAYERLAACLATALDVLRTALARVGLPVSLDLESAEVALGTTTDRECAHPTGGD